MKRFLSMAVAAVLTFALGGCVGCAQSSDAPFVAEETYLLFDSGDAPSSPGRSSVKTVLHHEGKTYLLLPTFDDPQAAIRTFMLRHPGVLQKLELTNLFLGPLNERNCGRYKEAAYGWMDAPWFESEGGQGELMALLCFIDILENGEDNRRILALAEAGDVEGAMMELPDQDALDSNLEEGNWS